jgi:hypothetical protein
VLASEFLFRSRQGAGLSTRTEMVAAGRLDKTIQVTRLLKRAAKAWRSLFARQ